MRIGHEHPPLAAGLELQQELERAGQEADACQRFALDAADIQSQFPAPILDAIPLQRSCDRSKARRQLRLRVSKRHSVGGGVAAGNEVQPKPVVEA